MKTTTRDCLALLFALFIPILVGCGESTTSPPPPSQRSMRFTATANPGTNSISLREVSRTATTLVLAVDVTSVSNLYGVSFDLTWNESVCRWTSGAEGSHLNQDGEQTAFQASLENAEQGRLIVGINRLGAVPGIGGSGTLLTLTFSANQAGSTGINFEAFRAVDPTGTAIPGTNWHGGTITVSG